MIVCIIALIASEALSEGLLTCQGAAVIAPMWGRGPAVITLCAASGEQAWAGSFTLTSGRSRADFS